MQIRSLLALVMLIVLGDTAAQNHWARRVGAWSNEAYNDVTIDTQGFLYTVGEFGGNIEVDASTTLISQGSLDVLVAKYDPNGTLVWARTFGGPGLDRAVKLALTADGNIAVVGQFMGAAAFDGTTLISQNGTQDMFVLKMAQADGAVVWARQGGSPDGVDQPNGVSVGPDGSIAVAGEFRGNAVFDQGTLTSITDPDNGQPSVDIFLATYAGDGTPLWIQQGAAEFADRGMDVVYDAAGNLYLTGQFSDTITFDQTHFNAMYSAVFIARFSPTGEEEWFRIFGGGTYNQVFEMLLVEDHLMLVGDVQGTVIFLDTEPDLFTAVEPRSSFLLEVDLDGELLRQKTWGSENAVNTRALSVHGDDIAVFGRFGCQFTGFSDGYGDGTFLATGPYDLYVARFRFSDLVFKEAQQFGGQGDKVPGGIVHTLDSTYVFAGSYERLLVFPDDGSLDADPSGTLLVPGAPSPYCSDAGYPNYADLRGSALKDAFIARGYVDSREPYDIFTRSGTVCDRSARDVLIRVGNDGAVGADSLIRCHQADLQTISFTSYRTDTIYRHTAPNLLFQWNTGQVTPSIIVYASGWYVVTVTSAEGCWQSIDSLYMTINPLPPLLLFNDDVVVNTNAHPPEPVEVCEPQHPWLWITGQPSENTITWTGPGGPVVNDSMQAFVTGIYTATATTPAGCYRSNFVEVTVYPSGPLPPIEAEFTITYPQDEDLNDTLYLCRHSPIATVVHVDLTLNGVPVGIPYGVTAYYACGVLFDYTPDLDFECLDEVLDEGWYVSNMAFMLTNRPCGDDSLLWFMTDSIYVIPFPVSEPDISLAGPALICPGDTVALTAICVGCDVGAWTGPNITVTALDTAWVIGPGIYEFTGTVVDTNGCSTSVTEAIGVDWNPQPLLAVDPLDGIICPNATATIWSEWEGLQYQWYGPLGPMNVDNDTIITSQQGFYYLEMIDSLGCNVSSDPILVTDYATPFLNVLPDGVLCEPGETATLQVVTTSTATLVWDAPFAGSNALQQVVTAPGIYTCSVNACGIITELSVEIFGNTANAELVTPGPFTLCPGDEVVLEAVPGGALYYWYPGPVFGPQITVDTTGVYLLVVTNAAGCQDSLFTEVTVLPEYVELTVLDTSFCAGEPVIVIVAGDDLITWYADPGMTVIIGTGDSLVMPGVVSDTTVWVQQEVGPCSSGLVQVDIGVYASPVSPTGVGDTSVCEGSVLQLTTQVQPGVTEVWWYGPTGVYPGDTLVIDPVGLDDQGTWFVIVGNPGCVAPPTYFNVGIVDAAPMDIGPDTVICSGGTAVFQVPPGFTQPHWHDGSSAPSYSTSSAGDVILVAIDSGGCTVRDTANVALFTFSQPLSPMGATICLGQDATLFANGSGIVSWFSDQSLMNVVHIGPEWFISQPTESATYYLQQDEGSCASGLVPVSLTVVPIPVDADIEAPPYVCEGSDLVLTVTGTNSPSGVWTTPSGTYQGASITIPNVAQGDAGTYTVVPSIGACTGDAVSVEVEVVAPDPLDLGPDTVFCEGGALQLALPVGYSDPVWSTSSTSIVISVSVPGTYSVQALDAQGCSVSDAILVDVVGCDPIIPNVVTPNGDGVNDVWILGPGGYVGAILDVYNRWGQLVWSGDVIHTGFRGNHMDNGEPLSEGTYFYVLYLTRGNGNIDDYTGHITLLR